MEGEDLASVDPTRAHNRPIYSLVHTLVVSLVGLCSGCLILTATLQAIPPARRPDQVVISAGAILVTGVCMFQMLRRGPYPLRDYGLTLSGSWRAMRQALLYSVPVVALLVLVKWLWLHADPARSGESILAFDVIFHGEPFRLGTYALALVLYALLSPVQELVVRAGLQSTLRMLMPQAGGGTHWKAIVFADLVFASVHSYIGFRFVLGVFFPGLFFGWLFEKQRSLAGVSLSHVVVGGVALFALGLQESLGAH